MTFTPVHHGTDRSIIARHESAHALAWLRFGDPPSPREFTRLSASADLTDVAGVDGFMEGRRFLSAIEVEALRDGTASDEVKARARAGMVTLLAGPRIEVLDGHRHRPAAAAIDIAACAKLLAATCGFIGDDETLDVVEWRIDLALPLDGVPSGDHYMADLFDPSSAEVEVLDGLLSDVDRFLDDNRETIDRLARRLYVAAYLLPEDVAKVIGDG